MSSEEYEKLKFFFGLFVDWYLPKLQESPKEFAMAFLADLESKSPSDARRGLQMALNDCMERTVSWSPQQVADSDKRFLEAGSCSVSEVRAKYSKTYLRVLKRGVINSEVEYYLMKNILDGGGIETGKGEGSKIEAMLSAFESKTA